jgi:ABC-type multidrug transport system fused ATPase/permease subunit
MIRTLLRDAARLKLGRRVLLVLLAFQLAGTVMELSSLVLLVPVFQYIQAAGDIPSLVKQYPHWNWLLRGYAVFGLAPTLGVLLINSFLFLVARQLVTFARQRYQARIKEGLIARVRAQAFEKFLYADSNYQDRAEAGGIVNDLTTDLQRAADYIFGSLAVIGMTLVFSIYIAGLFALSVPMTLTALAVFGLALAALRSQMRKSETTGREVVLANQRMSTFLVERLRLVRLVRLAGTERAETREMNALTDRQRGRLVRMFTLMARIDAIVEPLVIGAAFAFIFVSVTYFGMRIEEIGLFLVMILRLLPVTKELARMRQANRGSKPAHDLITARLDEMSAAREDRGGGARFEGVRSGIAFENVTFAYAARPNVPALDRVSLAIAPRRLTAIVGPSGAGKSTLFDMIPRLRRPQSGRIRIDGTNIEDFELASLRAGIAYAPQAPQVFNVPLIEHIRYGKPEATIEEVRRAAELANAAAFIEALPAGYDTLAGEGGTALSGGQRQRLDLARALVRRAPILLLDEPTSNLDADSEALFRDALMRIRAETQITILVIAHRLSTVTMADRIVVMQAGRIAAEGAHADLVAAGGWYASAFVKQGGDPRPELAVAAQ